MGQLHVPALTLGPGASRKNTSLSSRSLKYSRKAGHSASSLSGLPECSTGGINNVCVLGVRRRRSGVAWGWGSVFILLVRYSFLTGSPEDNFYTYSFGIIIFVKYFTVLRS